MNNTNYSPPTLNRESHEKMRRYQKYLLRLEKRLKDGSFWKYSAHKRRSLIKRIRRLGKQLHQLGAPLGRFAAASAVVAALATGTVQGQTASFTEKFGVDNPLNQPFNGYWLAPCTADIDNDGDFDVFVGLYDYSVYTNRIIYFENIGTNLAPNLVLQPDSLNPFNGPTFYNISVPELVDIDADGDVDAFVGTVNPYGPALRFFENTGTPSAPVFTEQFGANIPINIGTPLFASARFGDLDDDGDFDVMIGDYTYGGPGLVHRYFENQGTDSLPNFVEQLGTNNLFSGITSAGPLFPDFTDVDNDGDLDLFVGDLYGGPYSGSSIQYYENTGNSTTPSFTAQVGANNPLDSVLVADYGPVLAFADIDGDTDEDLFLGDVSSSSYSGIIRYFENTSIPSTSGIDPGEVVINEFLTINQGINPDQDGEFDPWIELYNTTGDTLDLSEAYLSDVDSIPTLWAFPDTSIAVNEFLIIWADGDTMQSGLHTPFALDQNGGFLLFANADSSVIDSISYDPQIQDITTGRFPNGTGNFTFMPPTPADTNEVFAVQPGNFVINEFMASNETELADQDGEYDDWIEFYNPFNVDLPLQGMFLTDDFSDPNKWPLPDSILGGGEYLLIWADDDTSQAGLHANFELDEAGGQLMLSYPTGTVLDSTNFGPQITDISSARIPNGAGPFQLTPQTAGESNEAFSISTGDLVINEFMAENTFTQADQDGEFDDWIELYNPTASELSLRGVFLTVDPLNPLTWKMPDTTLAANDYLIVWADDDDQVGLHANFELDAAQAGQLIMGYPNSTILDQASFGVQNPDETTGRYPNGTGPFGFMPPTFSAENTFFTAIEGLIGPVELSIFPNPTSGLVTIRLSEALNLPVELYNMNGQRIGNWKFDYQNRIQVDVSDIPDGVYLLKLGTQTSHRLMIRK